jgi:DNA-directed RNA polymerase I and III subunit RPAC1
MVSSDGGTYRVKKAGVEFEHSQNHYQDTLVSPQEYLDHFRNKFQMRILERPSEHELVLEFLHVDTSFVNALRRILLAEVPTVALENIYMWENSSLIHDEVLSHRLGLIPLKIDARLLDEQDDDDPSPTDRNTVVFRLGVSCGSDPNKGKAKHKADSHENANDAAEADQDGVVRDTELEQAAAEAAQSSKAPKVRFPRERPYTKHVYSKDLVWVPQGDQEERLQDICAMHDDILIAKLRPGQSIELEVHGRVGVGKDHAKFSPVATASYRLMPHIELLRDVYDEVADELVHVYEPGVFEIVPTDATDPAGTSRKARVCNPYACTMSRNYMRHTELAQAVRMSRIPDHFIFSVESVGMYAPGVLVAEALRILQRKCRKVMDYADEANLKQDHV